MNEGLGEQDLGIFLAALRFAAEKHRDQRRKSANRAPYINHPIAVVEILWTTGGVRDIATLVAAVLHDTIEDTDTSAEEIREHFGEEVLSLVLEVTDDKRLPQARRKQLQIETAPHKSPGARQIKLADKINNVDDITNSPPENWSIERRREYLDWTEKVVRGLRGQNPALEARYDQILAEGRRSVDKDNSISLAESKQN
jgi:guanosine-3',5'-bis(diphosphate) 3'-pyrophosphohydrolase